MLDETQRRYLFLAIDRAKRWAYLEVRTSQSTKEAEAFFHRVIDNEPSNVQEVLTNKGKCFTDRFTSGGLRKPTGSHLFDKACAQHHIEHRLICPGHSQINWVVEHFNGRISDMLATRRYESKKDLEQTLKCYCWLYNDCIQQKALHDQAPIAALKDWRIRRPELFHSRVINYAAPDS